MSKRKRKVLSVEDMIKLKTMSSFSLITRKLKDWDGLFYFTLYVNESDTRSNVHYLSSSENKASKNSVHRYRRSHGFKSRPGLNFFQALFSLLLK